MTKLLEGKTLLVTGASAGIGRAAAVGAARHGADVGINYSRDDAGAEGDLVGGQTVRIAGAVEVLLVPAKQFRRGS